MQNFGYLWGTEELDDKQKTAENDGPLTNRYLVMLGHLQA